MQRTLILIALVACGGTPARPAPKPDRPDPATLARQLDDDMSGLADLAHRHRGNCGGLAADLPPHVERMKLHAAEVERMVDDADRARELRAALAGYAEKAPTRTAQIGQDFEATYRICQDPTQRAAIERAIRDMPTYD